jgi:hypothetical protein
VFDRLERDRTEKDVATGRLSICIQGLILQRMYRKIQG